MAKRTLVLALVALALLGVASCSERDAAQRVLLYGDSLVWGWIPVENQDRDGGRYPYKARIAGVMQKELGGAWSLVEEGLNGRTAGVDVAFWNFPDIDRQDQNFNGRRTLLPAIWSHEPLRVVVIMLGVNDARNFLHQTIGDVERSVETLVKLAKSGSMQKAPAAIVLVSPPPVGKGASELFSTIFDEGSFALVKRYAAAYRAVAEREGVLFFDAASVVPVADGVDGVHLSAKSTHILGKALAAFVKENVGAQ
ncbi:MAG: GDSL-type esterase/lipase family protein [Spirochaetaceae bacterium]|jgi:lysophospholipase L1-like esterase|nr:GDSL-type esterase/lipase family protein [Spirochaetaceae bacterium]